MSPAPTRGRIGFPVIGPNDTGGGSGWRGTGDEIGRPLTATSRSPRWPLLAIPQRAGAQSVPVVVGRAQIVKLSADALGCAQRAAVRGPGILNGNGGSPPRRVDPLAIRLDPIGQRFLPSLPKDPANAFTAVADQGKAHPVFGNEAGEIVNGQDRIATAEPAQCHHRVAGRNDDRRRLPGIHCSQ